MGIHLPGWESRMQLLPMASSPDVSARHAVTTKTPDWEVLTTTSRGGGGVLLFLSAVLLHPCLSLSHTFSSTLVFRWGSLAYLARAAQTNQPGPCPVPCPGSGSTLPQSIMVHICGSVHAGRSGGGGGGCCCSPSQHLPLLPVGPSSIFAPPVHHCPVSCSVHMP